jgi:hypothetical protein
MPTYRRLVEAVFFLVAVEGARGQSVVMSVTGTVFYGSDGASDGTAKVFGGNGTLDNQPFALTITLDISQGNTTAYTCPEGAIYTSSNTAEDASSPPTGILRIGDGNFFLGTLPISSLSWSTTRYAPAPCGQFSSSAYVGYVENCGGQLSGRSSFFGTAYPLSTFPNGDWSSMFSGAVYTGYYFGFDISVYQNDRLVKVASGALNPQSFSVSGPVSCSGGSLNPPPSSLGFEHHYTVGPDLICSTSQPMCTPQQVFSLLREHPTPQDWGQDSGQPVNNCDETDIKLFGNRSDPVIHYVDPSTLSIINVTLPGHRLYPGEAIRSVISENGNIYIVTVGTGSSPLSWIFDLYVPYLWRAADAKIASWFGTP